MIYTISYFILFISRSTHDCYWGNKFIRTPSAALHNSFRSNAVCTCSRTRIFSDEREYFLPRPKQIPYVRDPCRPRPLSLRLRYICPSWYQWEKSNDNLRLSCKYIRRFALRMNSIHFTDIRARRDFPLASREEIKMNIWIFQVKEEKWRSA